MLIALICGFAVSAIAVMSFLIGWLEISDKLFDVLPMLKSLQTQEISLILVGCLGACAFLCGMFALPIDICKSKANCAKFTWKKRYWVCLIVVGVQTLNLLAIIVFMNYHKMMAIIDGFIIIDPICRLLTLILFGIMALVTAASVVASIFFIVVYIVSLFINTNYAKWIEFLQKMDNFVNSGEAAKCEQVIKEISSYTVK